MIEAVGHEQLAGVLRASCGDRLGPAARWCSRRSRSPTRDFAAHARSVDFIKRYVFPGGELVSLGALCDAAARDAATCARRISRI